MSGLKRTARARTARALLPALLVAALIAGCGGASTGAPATHEPVLSSKGLYRVLWESDPALPPLNQLHTWTLHVEGVGGAPLSGAALTLEGGMPGHAHGLPTQPVVTAEPGGGNYLIKGMLFHMPGAWEITVTVEGPAGVDVAVLPITVRP